MASGAKQLSRSGVGVGTMRRYVRTVDVVQCNVKRCNENRQRKERAERRQSERFEDFDERDETL
jgi:hypothetical protein